MPNPDLVLHYLKAADDAVQEGHKCMDKALEPMADGRKMIVDLDLLEDARLWRDMGTHLVQAAFVEALEK